MDSLLEARRIPGFRLLSRRRLAPLAQPRKRHDPGDLGERPSQRLPPTVTADLFVADHGAGPSQRSPFPRATSPRALEQPSRRGLLLYLNSSVAFVL
jgi:hypothetical protein